MGRPRKISNAVAETPKGFETLGADPVLRNAEGLSPADEAVEVLTDAEIRAALSKHIKAGMQLEVDSPHWFLRMDKFMHSGSLSVPIEAVVNSANIMINNIRDMNAAKTARNRQGAKYSGVGEILGRDGNPIDDAA